MNKSTSNNKKQISIFIRYTFILFLSYFFLSLFFLNYMMIFFSHISYYFLNIFTTATLNFNIITLQKNIIFLIVEECIAPNAYLLITLVFFTLPINLNLLFKIWFKSILWFSFFNLSRILILMFIHIKFGVIWFENLHLIFYEGLSGIVTALIIIYYLRKEKIKNIYPIYSDIKYLLNFIKKEKLKIK